MPWKTSTGRTLEYPHALLAKYARSQKLTKDEVSELLYQISNIHEANLELDGLVITLRQDNLRLQHENEFMLRLVNEMGGE